jgi:phytoene dehydrogenase-like protein
MATTNADILIVGGGHNGLVAGACLAKAGRKVLVLERRGVAGGQLAAGYLGAGFESVALQPGGQLRPDIVRELELARHGLTAATGPAPAYVSLLPGGGTLRLSNDATDRETIESIRRLSTRDADRWPGFLAFMNTAATFLDAAYRTPMPRLNRSDVLAQGLPLASLALRLRRLGRRDMFRVIRSLSMSAQEFSEEWFESEPLRAAIGALAIHGVTIGAYSAGGGLALIHNWLNRDGPAHRRIGGTQALADALVAALRAHGGQLRTDAAVERILVDKQQVAGVRLAGGEEIAAKLVLSSADPRHTLLDLVGARELPPEFVWHAQSIRMRGCVAKLHLLTDGRHGLPDGTSVLAPDLRYLERAYDAAKYGEISTRPYLEVTATGALVSIHFQFAPYGLRDGDWQAARAGLERLALDALGDVAPALRDSLREVRSVTPADLEQDFGLSEGDLNHGQLILDQLFFMRPMPGWSDHRTPVEGLYLCGSGVHGGGGVSGAAGRNAARFVLKSARA